MKKTESEATRLTYGNMFCTQGTPTFDHVTIKAAMPILEILVNKMHQWFTNEQ
jgi:hypothetical protein